MRETSYIEKIIPFIVNMMDKPADEKPGPGPQPEPENFKINGVALRLNELVTEEGSEDFVNWNLLYEGEYPEISNIKLSIAGHYFHGAPISGHWNFVAEDDAEILHAITAGGQPDYEHSTMVGTAHFTADTEKEGHIVFEGVDAAATIAGIIKNINTQWAEPGEGATAEAKVTVNGKVHTVPVLLEFTGDIDSIEVQDVHHELSLRCTGATFNEDIYHGLDAWHPYVEIRSLDNV